MCLLMNPSPSCTHVRRSRQREPARGQGTRPVTSEIISPICLTSSEVTGNERPTLGCRDGRGFGHRWASRSRRAQLARRRASGVSKGVELEGPVPSHGSARPGSLQVDPTPPRWRKHVPITETPNRSTSLKLASGFLSPSSASKPVHA